MSAIENKYEQEMSIEKTSRRIADETCPMLPLPCATRPLKRNPHWRN